MPLVIKSELQAHSAYHDHLISHGWRHLDNSKQGYEPGLPERYEKDINGIGHSIKIQRDGSWDHYSRATGASRHVASGHDFDSMVHHIAHKI